MPVIVTINLISVQFQLTLPAKTELGNKCILSRVEHLQLMHVIVTIKLISVQFQLKLPAKTELGNKYILSRVGAGAAYAC